MTATPIPRTLALTAYGDLDATVLRELPAGRRPVETFVVDGARARARAYERIREEIAAGRQCFVVCPLVEESEALQAKAATVEAERLARTEFADHRVALIHGQMPAAEKQEAMRSFAAGDADVLVATSVIEVGIDVPNATVMLIEAADRYGLSQLHQLRGRVGRGGHASLCILFGDPKLPRLDALANERDGFRLAEIDLDLRGAGEVLGTRQSGLPEFRVARLPDDQELLERAKLRADELLDGRSTARAARERIAARCGRRALRLRPRPDPGVRVVAGELRGRKLVAPAGGGTRPTADRVREALFSILGDVSGARVLDLYAGSGALGIEALSRGAAAATFVDSSQAAIAAIRRNLSELGLEAVVQRRDALASLAAMHDGDPYDLVFADPPYDSALHVASRLADLLPPLLTADAVIVTESNKRAPLELPFPLLRERSYGDTRIAVHRNG